MCRCSLGKGTTRLRGPSPGGLEQRRILDASHNAGRISSRRSAHLNSGAFCGADRNSNIKTMNPIMPNIAHATDDELQNMSLDELQAYDEAVPNNEV